MGRLGRSFKEIGIYAAVPVATWWQFIVKHRAEIRGAFKGGQEVLWFQGITELSEGVPPGPGSCLFEGIRRKEAHLNDDVIGPENIETEHLETCLTHSAPFLIFYA